LCRICNFGVFLDQGATFTNLDPAFIAETLTRQITGSITTLPGILADINYWTTFDPNDPNGVDYYQAGISAGHLVKLFFDININN
jgi:hypothetical protein